jgi:hypothetical protein
LVPVDRVLDLVSVRTTVGATVHRVRFRCRCGAVAVAVGTVPGAADPARSA